MKIMIPLAGVLAVAGQMALADQTPETGTETQTGTETTTISSLLQLSGEALTTWGNTHYSDSNFFAGLTLKAKGQVDLGAATLKYHGNLLLRSDHDDLPPDINDLANIEVALDMKQLGTIGYSTYNRCAGMGFPWVDGDVGNLGSVNIHPWVQGTWRCAGGTDVIEAADAAVDATDYFFYHNQLGRVTVDLWYDPDLNYGGYVGDDAFTLSGDVPPKFEGAVKWDLGPIILRAGGTNLKDRTAGFDVPLHDRQFIVSYDYQYLNAKPDWVVGHILALGWMPPDMGYFKAARLTYYLDVPEEDDKTHNYIAELRFAGKNWTFGLGGDGQGDYAAEGSYGLTEHLSLVAGWDSGFSTGDGWSGAWSPASSVPGRGDSYELGLKYTF